MGPHMQLRLTLACLAAVATHCFHSPAAAGLRAPQPATASCSSLRAAQSVISASPPRGTDHPAEAAGQHTRASFLSIAGASLLTTLAQPALATPVRAPLPSGKADPKDKEKLFKAAETFAGLGGGIKDPKQWDSIIEIISKDPFTPEGMNKMFLRAAMSLPKNAILGTDAGIWSGLKTETSQAMESFIVEIEYLNEQRAKGKGEQDTADLESYYTAATAKFQEFLDLYGDVKTNKYLKAYGIKGEEGDE
mmetsp:Transcript_11899/g.23462  ORF Transcript_11899/g.23462 Transcript_11899/m.23462 type:complete len:249 (-) Transcript_11899:49-795(-)